MEQHSAIAIFISSHLCPVQHHVPLPSSDAIGAPDDERRQTLSRPVMRGGDPPAFSKVASSIPTEAEITSKETLRRESSFMEPWTKPFPLTLALFAVELQAYGGVEL